MEIIHVMHTARSAVIEMKDGGRYFTLRPYRIFVNGAEKTTSDRTITSLYGLKPDSRQLIEVYDGQEKVGEVSFKTDYEFVTLDVTRFGAKGDGIQDDTHFIQAAIMACPETAVFIFPQAPTGLPVCF